MPWSVGDPQEEKTLDLTSSRKNQKRISDQEGEREKRGREETNPEENGGDGLAGDSLSPAVFRFGNPNRRRAQLFFSAAVAARGQHEDSSYRTRCVFSIARISLSKPQKSCKVAELRNSRVHPTAKPSRIWLSPIPSTPFSSFTQSFTKFDPVDKIDKKRAPEMFTRGLCSGRRRGKARF
ncbi:hypothetical protein HPP92_004104 [Vanilla planifolia]|uniref:Uncharacterized protein n=1 Tax=Vanilla planifolia TaxID=51239 RepID=A0A835SHM8_VANPL|nr:hypothetical protein HPP92_004104 [Vanilla planifolia]